MPLASEKWRVQIMNDMDSKAIFSEKAEDYAAFRPSYPTALIDFLVDINALSSSSTVADIGCGTGILAELFLKSGNAVFGVEPNPEMRRASETYLSNYTDFKTVAGSAEETTLFDKSVDLISVGHAFHWFRPGETLREFQRIIRRGGFVLLCWNERRVDRPPFNKLYDQLIKKYGNAPRSNRGRPHVREDVIEGFLKKETIKRMVLSNTQILDWEGIKGRFLSSSYAPPPGHKLFAKMLEQLHTCFLACQNEGKIQFEYEMVAHCGQI